MTKGHSIISQWEVEIITHPDYTDNNTIVARMNIVVEASDFINAVDVAKAQINGAYTVVAVVNLEISGAWKTRGCG